MTELLKQRFYQQSLILAILLRLLIMPFFFHPDIKTYHYQVAFLKQGIWDIYSYLPSHKEKLSLKEEFVYFPLTYFILGGYQVLISPLLGSNFDNWLSDASASAIDQIGVFRYLFLLKLPYLLLDIVLGLLLTKFFVDETKKRLVFLLWLFNPFSLALIYFYSNVDIFPVLFTTLSLLYFRKNPWLAGLMLGIGAGFKAYPLLFVPLLLLACNSWRERLLFLISSVGLFGLIILPFVKSAGFQQATLASGLTTRIISQGIPLGFDEIIFPGVVFLSGVFFYAWKKWDAKNLVVYYFCLLLALFSTIHYHIQWLLWLMPFVIILFTRKLIKNSLLMVLIIIAFSIPLLYDDKSMTVSLLSPISVLFTSLFTPFQIISKIYNPTTIQSILHSLLLGGALIVIWGLLSKENDAS